MLISAIAFHDIFLDKDVLLESVSTIMMPLHSEKIQEYLTSLVDGSVAFKIFDLEFVMMKLS